MKPTTTPIYCDECGRANAETARTCLWCGLPIIDGRATGSVAATRVEIGYLGGIARFEDPAQVRLTVSDEGIEVAELLPGTRSFKLPVSSIVEANWVDASTMTEGKKVRPKGWWLTLRPRALLSSRRKTPAVKEHDYILAIKYKMGDEIETAVFHRRDRTGLAVIQGLARIVSSLIRKHEEK